MIMENPSDMSSTREISMVWDGLSAEVLKDRLHHCISGHNVTLEVRRLRAEAAITDPTVLVAVVSGASAAMTAIIMGLFRLLEREGQKIVLQARHPSKP